MAFILIILAAIANACMDRVETTIHFNNSVFNENELEASSKNPASPIYPLMYIFSDFTLQRKYYICYDLLIDIVLGLKK